MGMFSKLKGKGKEGSALQANKLFVLALDKGCARAKVWQST